MLHRISALILCCSMVFAVAAQKRDRHLQKAIAQLVQGFHGDIGVYVKNLKNGKIASINADTLFPTASMVKIPILIGLMDRINRGELDYHQVLQYKDSLLYAGVDLLGSFKSDEKIELSKVMMLMLSMSDNTASLWLQSLAGSGTRINELLNSLGFSSTRVNSRTPGREEARNKWGWGQTTPGEMAALFEKIYKGDVVSKAACDRMLRSLNRNYFDGVSISQIPPYAAIFCKNGAVNASRSEVVLVKGRKSNYLFCICTKNNKDESWTESNEAWQLTCKLSRLLWKYFEPGDGWEPAAEPNRFN